MTGLTMTDDPRPQCPERPSPDECCGGGCTPCILEVYEDERAEYHDRMVEWLGRHPPHPQPLEAKSDRTRLVLDTNVSLDIFVFRDPHVSPLLKMFLDGKCEMVMCHDCREEYLRVLTYPQFDLSPLQQLQAIEGFDTLHRLVDTTQLPAVTDTELPKCADPDDQKFLQLAWQSHADVLLSKDKAVLQLARRVQRDGLFTITTPRDWLAQESPQQPQA